MFSNNYLIFSTISFILMSANTHYIDVFSNQLYTNTYPVVRPTLADQNLLQEKIRQQLHVPLLVPGPVPVIQPKEKVTIQLYYESMCPDCRIFDGLHFIPTVKKLGDHLHVHVYPYGNAQTIIRPDGTTEIKCQHGPAECYGNMLHACAIDNIENYTTALYYNACMMDYSQLDKGSDDAAADKCGHLMYIDPTPIKSCAKGDRGLQLLKLYGEMSKMAAFRAVPHILINGVQNNGNNFFEDVCSEFKVRPQECNQSYSYFKK